MKNNDNILTLQEVEQLCNLYMECQLSVREETELQYMLLSLPYSSPVIEEVRAVMRIEAANAKKIEIAHKKPKRRLLRRTVAISAAASVAILIGIGVSVSKQSQTAPDANQPVYLAYTNGNELSREQAVAQVEEDLKRADAFMNHVAMLQDEELSKLNNFYNHNSIDL